MSGTRNSRSDCLLYGYKEQTAPEDIPTRRAPSFDGEWPVGAFENPEYKAAQEALNRQVRKSLDLQAGMQEVRRKNSTRRIDIVTTNRMEDDLVNQQQEEDVEKAKARMMGEIDSLAAKVSLPQINLPLLPNASMKLALLRRLIDGLTTHELKTELTEYVGWSEDVLKIMGVDTRE